MTPVPVVMHSEPEVTPVPDCMKSIDPEVMPVTMVVSG